MTARIANAASSGFVDVDQIEIHLSQCFVANPNEGGDVLRPYIDPTQRFLGIGDTLNYWNASIVPYEFGVGFEDPAERQLILDILTKFSCETCIQFIEKRPSHSESVRFTRAASGCMADLGMKNGGQNVALGDDCMDPASISHNIMHILGFRHENVIILTNDTRISQ